MRIAIVGAGVVGSATGMGLAACGHAVMYYDVSSARRESLAREGHHVVERLADANDCDAYMVCVPTPPGDDGFELCHLRAAMADVAAVVERQRFVTIVVRSTVLPGTMRGVVVPILETGSHLRVGEGVGLCYNPEFLRATSALDDLMHAPITVVGEFDETSADLVTELHAPFGAPVLKTTPENAEAIKCFSNVYNATKVSFFNLLHLAGLHAGFDSAVVARAMESSSLGLRVPSYYTAGGYPYGGECLPKDLAACTAFLRRIGVTQDLLVAVKDVNDEMARLDEEYASGGAVSADCRGCE